MAASSKGPATNGEFFAWALYDWANSGFFAVIQTFVFAAYFVEAVAVNPIIGSTQWGNIIGAAGLVIAIAGPILGAIADQLGRRKPWIFTFSLLCIGATAALWFVKPDAGYAPLALILIFLGTVGSECAIIFYNAMLPDLAPRQKMGRWSGWGVGLGYAGGLVCSLIIFIFFIGAENPPFALDAALSEPIRASFIVVALWYLLFSLPLLFKTPDVLTTGISFSEGIQKGWIQLRGSIKSVKKYRPILKFLIARMVFIDALATVFAFGGIYAAGTFDMATSDVLWFGIALNLTAGLGSALFAWVDDWVGSRMTILLSLVGLIITVTAILLITSLLWFWVIGLTLGLFVGPVLAASRSYMARVSPPKLQNQMFGLMSLSGKVTAFVGPFLVGWLTYAAGSQRIGMSVIVVLFIIGFILLWRVPDAEEVVRSRQ